MIKDFLNRFSKTQLWYLATVCGFAIGWSIGWITLYFIPSSNLLRVLFWAYPAAGAGLGIGIGQWSIFRNSLKNSYFWIPITMIGVIASFGAILTLLFAIPAYFRGAYETAYGGMVAIYTPIAPFALLVGPTFQWLIVWDSIGEKPYKILLKFIVGWILSILMLLGLLYLCLEIDPGRSSSRNLFMLGIFLFVLIGIPIPSGLILAHTTKSMISAN